MYLRGIAFIQIAAVFHSICCCSREDLASRIQLTEARVQVCLLDHLYQDVLLNVSKRTTLFKTRSDQVTDYRNAITNVSNNLFIDVILICAQFVVLFSLET